MFWLQKSHLLACLKGILFELSVSDCFPLTPTITYVLKQQQQQQQKLLDHILNHFIQKREVQVTLLSSLSCKKSWDYFLPSIACRCFSSLLINTLFPSLLFFYSIFKMLFYETIWCLCKSVWCNLYHAVPSANLLPESFEKSADIITRTILLILSFLLLQIWRKHHA